MWEDATSTQHGGGDKTTPPETMKSVINQNENVFMCHYQQTKQVVPEECQHELICLEMKIKVQLGHII